MPYVARTRAATAQSASPQQSTADAVAASAKPPHQDTPVVYVPDPQYNWGSTDQLTPPFEQGSGAASRPLFLGEYSSAAVQQEFQRFLNTKRGPAVASYFGLCGAAAAISANPLVLASTDAVFQSVWVAVVCVCFLAMGTLLGFSCLCDYRQRRAASLRARIDCGNRSAMILSQMCTFWGTVLACLVAAWDLRICSFTPAPDNAPDERKCESFLPDPTAGFLWVAFAVFAKPRAAAGSGFLALVAKAIASALYHIASSDRIEVYLIDLALTSAYLLASVLFVFVRTAASRRHFEEAVAASIAKQSELDRGAELRELTAALLPPALLARLGPQTGADQSLRESLHDAAADATALATGMADLGALQTRFFEPTRVVHVIARFFELFDAGAAHFHVDRAMVVGDVYVVVAGLIEGSHSSVPRLQQFAHWQHAVDETGSFPLRSAAATGALAGDVLGSAKTLRYHVSGAALCVALDALRQAPAGTPVCCGATLRKCATRVSSHVFTAAGGARFAAMPANDARPGSSSSSSTDPDEAANAGALASVAISDLDRLRAKTQGRQAAATEDNFQNPFDNPAHPESSSHSDAPTGTGPAAAQPAEVAPAGPTDDDADKYSMLGCVFASLSAEREVRETAARELSEGFEMALLFAVVALSPLVFLLAHVLDRHIHGEQVFALGLLGPIAAVVANAALAVEVAASTRDTTTTVIRVADAAAGDDDSDRDASEFRSTLCVQQRRVLVMLLSCSACSFGILFTPYSGARNMPFFVVFVWLPAFARLTSVLPIAPAVALTTLLVALPLLLTNVNIENAGTKIAVYLLLVMATSLVEASALRRRHRAWAYAEAQRTRAEVAYQRLRQVADSLLPSGGAQAAPVVGKKQRHVQTEAAIRGTVGGLGEAASGATEYVADVFDSALVAAISIADPSLQDLQRDPLVVHWDAVDFALVATTRPAGRGGRGVQLRVLRAAGGTVLVGATIDSTASAAAVGAHAAALVRCVQTVVREVTRAAPDARVAAALAAGELVGGVLGGAAARYGAFGRCSAVAEALLAAAGLVANAPPSANAERPRAFAVATLAFTAVLGEVLRTTVSERPWAVEGVPFGRVALVDVGP